MSDGGHNPDVTPMAVAGPGAAALAARQAGPALLLASRLAARTTPLVIGAFGAGLVARYAVGGGVAELGLDIARRLAPAEGHATGAELALAAHGGLQRQAAVARWSPAAALPRHPTLPTGSRPGVDLVADTLAGAGWGEPTAEWPATPTAPASRQPSPTGQPEPPPHSAPSSDRKSVV